MKIETAISDKYVRTNLGVPCFQRTNFIQKAANIYPSGGPEFVLSLSEVRVLHIPTCVVHLVLTCSNCLGCSHYFDVFLICPYLCLLGSSFDVLAVFL